jgi:carbohydrate kinase (thermoresistant glucokinase family)
MIVIVMGVSGVGKTTVGRLLAEALGAEFLEGDEFHSPANVAKMRRGTPLTDDDRRPWLEAMARALARRAETGRSVVLACSALKRRYRRILVGDRTRTRFVYLKGDAELIAKRLAGRPGHYMPASLLASQFAALEEPTPEERAITLDVALRPEALVAKALPALAPSRPPREEAPVGRDSLAKD